MRLRGDMGNISSNDSYTVDLGERVKLRKRLGTILWRISRSSMVDPVTRYLDLYNEDGLISMHNHDFIRDPAFIAAYERGMGSPPRIQEPLAVARRGFEIRWRLHVCLWAASHAIQLPGSFVECGVNLGFLSLAIMQYLDWNSRDTHFYLFDTFCGLDETQLSAEEILLGRLAHSRESYPECFEQVKKNFQSFSNFTLVRGSVPSTLNDVYIEAVSYLSIDMNCAEPELQAAEFFWPKLVSGGIVLIDDYGHRGYEPEGRAFDEFAREKQIGILSLPTGQGLIIRP